MCGCTLCDHVAVDLVRRRGLNTGKRAGLPAGFS